MYENRDEQGYGDVGLGRVVEARPAIRGRGVRRWLLIGALALALALAVGAGAVIGSAFLNNAQAASLNGGGGSATGQTLILASGPQGPQGTQGAQGQCAALTVSSVSGSTIVAKAADGSTVTIHTTAGTTYTRDGQTANASAVTVGARIHVQGTRNSDGSITATAIDVG